MMNPKKLSLSWDSYKTSISHGLGLLQQQGEFVDMTLAADGHHVKVHQIVLSLVSPFIKELITSANCPHPVIFLNKMSYDTLQSILEYVYTGEVMVTPEGLVAFLDACKELHIKGLQDINIQGDSNNLLQLIGARKTKNSEDLFPQTSPVEIISRAEIKRRRIEKKEVPIEYIFSDCQTHDDDVYHDETNDGGEADYDDEADDHDGDDDDNRDDDDDRNDDDNLDDETHDGDETHASVEIQAGDETHDDDEKHNVGYPHNDGMEDKYAEIAPYKAGSRWVCRGAHYYMVQRVKGQTTYLRCASDKCPAHWKLSKKKGAGPVIGIHNHEPTPWVPSRNAMFQALKRRTMAESIPLTAIYEQEAARYQDAVSHLPFESVAPSMRKWRRSAKPISCKATPSTQVPWALSSTELIKVPWTQSSTV